MKKVIDLRITSGEPLVLREFDMLKLMIGKVFTER